LIAQSPAEPRDMARLMVVRFKSRTIAHYRFTELPRLLQSGDLVVVNDTRVMAARLRGQRPDTSGAVEALLVRPFTDTRWETLFKPARQALEGRTFVFDTTAGAIAATVVSREEATVVL